MLGNGAASKNSFSLNLKKPKVNSQNIKEFLASSKQNKQAIAQSQSHPKLLGKFRYATPNKQVRFINYAATVQNKILSNKKQQLKQLLENATSQIESHKIGHSMKQNNKLRNHAVTPEEKRKQNSARQYLIKTGKDHNREKSLGRLRSPHHSITAPTKSIISNSSAVSIKSAPLGQQVNTKWSPDYHIT